MAPDLVLLLLCLAGLSAAQGLSVPAGWRKPAFTESRDDRIQIAQKFIDLVAQNISNSVTLDAMGSLQSANVIATVALNDYLAGSTQQQALVNKTLFNMVTNPSFASVPNTDSPYTWILACTYAYRAYQDPALLKLAEDAWAASAVWQITEADAQAGTHPMRNFTFAHACSSQTVAGGVFYVSNDRNDSTVDSAGVGMFVMAAAHLAELTQNQTYLGAAVLSSNFARDIFLNPSNLMTSQIDVRTCQANTTVLLRDSGIAAHAWSVLGDQTGDTTWQNLSINVLVASTQSNLWAGPDGILASNGSSSDTDTTDYNGAYVRDLYEPWIRSVLRNNDTVSSYVGAYMAVQYNALQDLASDPTSGYYSSNWHGPAVNHWTMDGVETSVGLLVAAIAPHDYNQTSISSTSPPTSSGSSTTSTSPSSSISPAASLHKHSAVAVTGGAVAGVIVGAILALALFLFLRRRRRSRTHIKLDSSGSVASRWNQPSSGMFEIDQQAHTSQQHEMQPVSEAVVPSESAVAPQATSPSTTRLVQVVTHVYEVQTGDGSDDVDLPPYAEAPAGPAAGATASTTQARRAPGRKGRFRS